MARSTSIASSTLRVIGPSLSSDQHRVIAPVRATRPYVGRNPVTPHRMLGPTMLPPVSLPMAKPTRPAAVAAPGPALEPDDPSSSSQGFIVCPPNQTSVKAETAQPHFRHQDSARRVQPLHHHGIFRRDTIAEWLGSVRSPHSCRVEQVFCAPWNSMKRAAVLPCCNFLVSPLCSR